jgi:hypothetical protein
MRLNWSLIRKELENAVFFHGAHSLRHAADELRIPFAQVSAAFRASAGAFLRPPGSESRV